MHHDTDSSDPYGNLSTLLSTSIFIQIILFVVFSAYDSEYLGIKYLLIMCNIANVGLALIIKLYLQVLYDRRINCDIFIIFMIYLLHYLYHAYK